MKKSFLFSLILIFACACHEKDDLTLMCNTEATVRDLTGLGGCSFVFELKDGTRLEPVILFYCGTPPLPAEVTQNPLHNFQFAEGKRVRIGYIETTEFASTCMAGKMVKITCLEELGSVGE